VGFENPLWNAQYFPENCPEEWRLAYYMNDFRVVYLPCAAWFESGAQIAMLSDELDDAFELVIEWPPLTHGQDIEATLSRLAPLAQNISCIVLNVDGISGAELNAAYQAIATYYDINFCSNAMDIQAQEVLARQYETGFVWFPARTTTWALAAPYQVVRLPCQSLREMKPLLDQLRSVIEPNTRVGLFFEPAEQSAGRALEVRTLIELMGLA
jgi:hypothetical protein